ncbi:predicted protein [Naegleria gruberi]|uniref:Predicted protein n=1 Tax=Naegleria gruberi TaxID=5762 RepID=D2VGR1_NAEGR|nr:uncharacterized protein NAEGRDRAFT_68066 [Naegleria gruberi]EFC44012.1 predicted protein [Naegleria gruberi]|eukprot:XP_002676756.1 predicted protein [Naegleria gruberi strain NEG-M]
MPLNLNFLQDSSSDEEEDMNIVSKNQKPRDFISFDDSDDDNDDGEDVKIVEKEEKVVEKEPEQQKEEEKVAENVDNKIAQVTKTRDNILSLFSSAQSQWSHHYNIDMALQQKIDGKPILSNSMKERLAAIKSKKKEINGNITINKEVTPTTVATNSSTTSSGTLETNEEEKVIDEKPKYIEPESPSVVVDNDDVIEIKENNEEESTEGFIKIDDTISNHQYNYEAHNAYAKYQTTIPWQTQDYSSYPPPLRLHYELIDFYNFVKQTKEEELVRERVLEKVMRLCKNVDPNCRIQMFGSYPAGLMLPGSDLDLHVLSRSLSQKVFLEKLNRELNKSTEFVEINFIRNANVPIIKFKEAISLQEVDVSCNNADTDSSVEFIRRSSEKYPAFKYLCYFLKYFLKQRNLNMVLYGGLSSYGLSLMIVSHLQMHTSNSSIEERDVTSLGTLLLDFFALYGRYFNYYFAAISPSHEGKYLPYQMKIRSGYSSSLKFTPNIIDPTNPSNNVSKGSSALLSIRNSFSNAFDALISPTNINKESLLSTILRVSPDLCWRRIYIHQDQSFLITCKQFAKYFNSYITNDEEDNKYSNSKKRQYKGTFTQSKKKKF